MYESGDPMIKSLVISHPVQVPVDDSDSRACPENATEKQPAE